VLIRHDQMGFRRSPCHARLYGKIIGSDAAAGPGKPAWHRPGSGLEINTLTIGSGETYDWLIDMHEEQATQLMILARTHAMMPAATCPSQYGGRRSRHTRTSYHSARPRPLYRWTGRLGSVLGQDVGQYYPFHNHDDYKATNNGDYPVVSLP